MKNNFEIIRSHLEYGHKKVEAKLDKRHTVFFIGITPRNGLIDHDGIEYDGVKLNKVTFTSITPIPHRYKRLEVGTKVDVLESFCENHIGNNNWEIIETSEFHAHLKKERESYENKVFSDWSLVPLWAITPHVEEELQKPKVLDMTKECNEFEKPKKIEPIDVYEVQRYWGDLGVDSMANIAKKINEVIKHINHAK